MPEAEGETSGEAKATLARTDTDEQVIPAPSDSDDVSSHESDEEVHGTRSMYEISFDNDNDEKDCMSPSASSRTSRAKIRRRTLGAEADKHLHKHRRSRQPDDTTKAKLLLALKANRFCAVLSSEHLNTMLEKITCFEFEAEEKVANEGDPPKFLFIVEKGLCEECSNGQVTRTLTGGTCTYGLGLVYDFGRTVSIVAKSSSVIWGVDRDTFKEVLLQHCRSRYQENRQFLDQLNIFDGLSIRKKERVSRLAIFSEVHKRGSVIRRSTMPSVAAYVVKSGTLVGQDKDKNETQRFGQGDSFGWRSVMFGELSELDVVAKTDSEMLGISIGALERALGGKLVTCLMRSFILSCLRKICVFSLLPPEHLTKIAEGFSTELYEPGDKLPKDVVLAIVVDGSAEIVLEENGEKKQLMRGDIFEHETLKKIHRDSEEARSTTFSLGEVSAIVPGCRFSILSAESSVAQLRLLNVPIEEDDGNGLKYLKKAFYVRKVPVFQELSNEQIDGLVMSLVDKKFEKNTAVFEQGTVGDAFYIITSGKADIIKDGIVIKDLGPGSSFGERALLFNEPRSATIKALDVDLEVWSVDRKAFRTAITESMRQNLIKTIQYTGTNVCLKDVKHLRFIGAGAFGTVRMVEHKKTGLRYALKRIAKVDGKVPPEVDRECMLLLENRHPFLLHYVGTFESEKSKYILTELVTGGALQEQVLEKMGVLPRKAAQFYTGSLALSLESLHERRIVFRDLKPENVMLDSQGYVKLVDFGLAKRLTDDTPRTYSTAGTMFYMAPEVVNGVGYGTECDIWSLGVMLYEFVCGGLPFGQDSEDPKAILCDILEKPLEFPSRYNDNTGKKFLEALLKKNIESRLGAGSTDWTDVKANKFFKQGVSGNLFSLITGRELEAPVVPEGEQYSPESAIRSKVTESDAEELGSDETADIGCRLLVTFKKFDLNNDGRIDKDELTTVLCELDPKNFTPESVETMFKHIDKDNKGAVEYEDFVAWVINEETPMALRSALRGSVQLDAHK